MYHTSVVHLYNKCVKYHNYHICGIFIDVIFHKGRISAGSVLSILSLYINCRVLAGAWYLGCAGLNRFYVVRVKVNVYQFMWVPTSSCDRVGVSLGQFKKHGTSSPAGITFVLGGAKSQEKE